MFFNAQLCEWLKQTDCKSVAYRLRWFESITAHHFVERSSKGRKTGFDPVNLGSNPSLSSSFMGLQLSWQSKMLLTSRSWVRIPLVPPILDGGCRQVVKTTGCDPVIHGFESHQSPQFWLGRTIGQFTCLSRMRLRVRVSSESPVCPISSKAERTTDNRKTQERYLHRAPFCYGVTQLVESWSPKPVVGGSSPSTVAIWKIARVGLTALFAKQMDVTVTQVRILYLPPFQKCSIAANAIPSYGIYHQFESDHFYHFAKLAEIDQRVPEEHERLERYQHLAPIYALVVKWRSRDATNVLFWVRVLARAPIHVAVAEKLCNGLQNCLMLVRVQSATPIFAPVA